MILGPRQAAQLVRKLPDPLRYKSFPVRNGTQGRKSEPEPSAVSHERSLRYRPDSILSTAATSPLQLCKCLESFQMISSSQEPGW